MANVTPGELHELVGPAMGVNPDLIEGTVIIVVSRKPACICPPEDPCIAVQLLTDKAGDNSSVLYMLSEGMKAVMDPETIMRIHVQDNGPSPYS